MLHTISQKTFKRLFFKTSFYLSILCSSTIPVSQCFAQNSLVCNQSIQISLSEVCEAVITPGQIIKNYDPYIDYSMEVTGADGQIIPDHKVTVDHIGEQINVTIKNTSTNISCWSTVVVESKIFPEFHGCGDIIIPCGAFPDTLDYMPRPEMGEGQCGTYSISHEDRIVEQQCSADGYSHIVYRTWILENQSKFTYTCEQRIYVKRQTLADLYFPPHFNASDYPAISCDYELLNDEVVYPHSIEFAEDLSPSIKSYPLGTGFPGGEYCSNIKVNFNDTQYPSCGNQIKILRRWNIIDWCTGKDKVQDQVIEIVDDRGPILKYSGHYETIHADYADCFATIQSVPFPLEVHDCSETAYSVAYKYKNEFGYETDEITTGVSRNDDGTFKIAEIPLDTITMVYTVTDDCGHPSKKEVVFRLKDTKPPVAICQTRSVVTLIEGGYAVLAATQLQHHSFDNCGIVKQLIKRTDSACENNDSDLDYGSEITFCCTDSGDVNHGVSLRLFDRHGNYADCQTEIVVQDKIKPVITNCAPHKEIHCQIDHTDIQAMGGEPEVYDNCHMTMTYEDDDRGLNSCGFGKMFRTWKASDDHGNWSTCIQEIHIINEFATSSHDIVWPRPKTLTECTDADYSPTKLGEPSIPYANCSNFAFTHDDQVFYDGVEECMKILRHWTVIDWCVYDPASEVSDGYWTQTQSIRLSDSTKPIFQTECKGIVVKTSGTDCEVLVNIEVDAIDECSLHDLDYSHTTYKYDAEPEMKEGKTASILFPPGEHSILFQVSDGCGNTDECEVAVVVNDNNYPHLICLQKLSISLGATGETEIWASDFVKEANVPCHANSELDFSFTEDMSSPILPFSCTDFIEIIGSSLTKSFSVYGIDDLGRKGSCSVDITVTDNFNLCAEETTSSGLINGKVFLENGIPVINKMAFLEDMNMSSIRENETTELGEYSFDDINVLHEYKLEFESSGKVLDGISTLDLIAIQKHILSTEILDSPYKIIAADIDHSFSITATDLLYLRKLILGLVDDMPNQRVWRYIDADYVFMDDTQPWEFQDFHYVRQVSEGRLRKDFVAIKLGDVNTSLSQSETRNNSQVSLKTSISNVDDNSVQYKLNTEGIKDIYGYQLSLNYDAEYLTLQAIIDHEGNQMNHNLYVDNEGVVTISYSKAISSHFDSHLGMLTLQFKKEENSETTIPNLIVNPAFDNEIYSGDLEVIDISEISKHDRPNDTEKIIVVNAYPNPFISNTSLSIVTAEPTNLTVTMYTPTGMILFSENIKSVGGLEWIPLEIIDNNYRGILYCKIETESYQEIKQLVRIDN